MAHAPSEARMSKRTCSAAQPRQRTRATASSSVLRALRLLATLWAGVACQAQPDLPAADRLTVEVRVDRAAIGVVAVARAGTTGAARPSEVGLGRGVLVGRPLFFELRGDRGLLIASGSTVDPRAVHAELPTRNGLRRVEAQSGVGMVALDLPALAGDLSMAEDLKADGSLGSLVGQTHFDPSLGTSSPSLLTPGDVLGASVKFVDHGDARNNLNLLFLPEGYQEAELSAFHRDATQMMNGLLAHPSYQRYAQRFNASYLDVRSHDSGIDDPDQGVSVDTAFDATFGHGDLHRLTTVGDAAIPQLYELARSAGADVVVVIANSDQWGGSGGQCTVVTRATGIANGLSHELGHRLFGLGDEYEYPGDDCDGSRHWSQMPANLSPVGMGDGIPWQDLIAPGTPLPTPSQDAYAATVGAFAGAGYCSSFYRPQLSCLMRSVDAQMCAVCRREMARFFERLVDR